MLYTPEYHQVLADFARAAAENMEVGATNPHFTEQDRAQFAEWAREKRRIQAYHEEAARLAEQGIAAPDWSDWLTRSQARA